MSILNEAIIEEIKELVQKEVKKGSNEVKIEDAKIIVQVLLPEIDRIVTSKINKMVRKIATEIISWDLVEETEEKEVKPPDGYKLEDSGNSTHLEPIEEGEKKPDLNNWEFQEKPFQQ